MKTISNPQRFTRREEVLTIANGKNAAIYPSSDYFHVHSILDASNVSRTVKVDVNASQKSATIGPGQGGQGMVGAGEIHELNFTNNSGVDVTVTVIIGNGRAYFSGLATIQAGTLDLSSASIAALLNAKTLDPFSKVIGDGTGGTLASPQVYSNCKAIFIQCLGPGNATVTYRNGDTDVLADGDDVEFTVENDADIWSHFTIAVDPGTTCRVRGGQYL